MENTIGRIRKIVGKDGVFDIVLEFPKAWVYNVRPVDPRLAFGPTEQVAEVSEWETVSLSDFIYSRAR